jgi:hypothetical protein
LLSLSETGICCESGGGIDLSGRNIGRRVKINVEGETVLVVEGVDFESAQGFVGSDLVALALPLRRGLQPGRGLLEGIEQKPGATVVDAVVGKSVDDLLNAS